MRDLTIQSQNKINLVGKLLDVSFGSGTLSDGRPYERATVTLRVTQTYGGREETSEVPFSIFATQYTRKGTPNPSYKTIQDLHNMKTVQEVGFDNADTVRVTGASIRENAFVTRSGQLVNGWQLNGSFMSVTNAADTASFVVDIFVMDMHPEVDANDEPTGRLVIKGGIVQYGEKLDVVEFIVEQPDAVAYIERNWNPNDTVTVMGRIRVTSQEQKVSGGDSSWGEDIPQTTTRFVRELIITKGDDEGKEEEFAYDPVEIKKAFNVRKANIEQMQLDAQNGGQKRKAAAPSASKYNWE